MSSVVSTTWVAPPRQTTGLDHLAVRAVSEAYYAELVPCVTNVTDRIRSYAFYPWVLWSFSERFPGKNQDEFVHAFRRAEILLALIGAQHEQELKESPAIHGEGLPGRFVLLRALREAKDSGVPLSLRRFATLDEGKDRYFKARLGGLGQYYLGTLQLLDVLGRASGAEGRYAVTPRRGLALAQAFDANVPGNGFWEAIEADQIDEGTLNGLAAFCPCQLASNENERTALIDVILGRDEAGGGVPDMREAVLLLLQAALVGNGATERRDAIDDFRWAAFAGTLAHKAWQHPAVASWRSYQQHEILGLCVQSLFHAVYELFQETEDMELHTSREVASWTVEQLRKHFTPGFLEGTFSELLQQISVDLPSPDNFESEHHERNLCLSLLEQQDYVYSERLETVARTLGSLILRLPEGELYGGLSRPDSYFALYPVNLKRLRALAFGEWQSMKVETWLKWLIQHWAVGQQHRVALRKLRDSGEDTFRLRPTEHGLVPQKNVEVTFSNPRLNEALRALQDLRLLDENVRPTDAGRRLREELDV